MLQHRDEPAVIQDVVAQLSLNATLQPLEQTRRAPPPDDERNAVGVPDPHLHSNGLEVEEAVAAVAEHHLHRSLGSGRAHTACRQIERRKRPGMDEGSPLATAPIVVKPGEDRALHAGRDVLQGRHRSLHL